MKKNFGIWLGKYKFFGRFQVDLRCVGGVRRSPAVFNIGAERGFLFYPGQPSYCRKCFVYGNSSNDCDQKAKCRFCGKEGNFSKDCKELRRCHICKEPGHLAKQCDWHFSSRRWVALEERVAKRQTEKDGQSGVQQKPKRAELVGRDGARPGDTDLAITPPGYRADEAVSVERSAVADGVRGAGAAIGDAVVCGSPDSGGPAAVAGEDGGMMAGVTS